MAGHLTSVDNFNGIVSSFKYDKADRVIAIKNQRSDSSILTSYDFTLDGNGNKTKIAKNEPQSLTLGVSDTPFTYNFEKNRLLTAGGSTFSYDAEGQLSGTNTDTFTFDYDHRLTAINGASTVQFTYDARDARVKAVRNNVVTKYIYDAGGNLLAEADDTGTIQKYYIYGAGLLASITPTDEIYTYHYNGNGNTIAITDQSQLIVNSYAYTPYGQITTEVENITNPFKFAGQFGIMSEGSDIYYMRARYYDASVGRFISEDSSGFSDGANLSAYVGGNPINYADPTGNVALPLVTGAIGAVAGGFGNTISQIISNGGTEGFSWGEVGISAGVGFAAGAAAPFVATSTFGAALLGGTANVTQYAIMQSLNKQGITAQGFGINFGIGLLGGYVAGPINQGSGLLFSTNSNFIKASFARSLNNDIAIQANTALSNILRNLLGGVISNLNSSVDATSTNPNMCKESACF